MQCPMCGYMMDAFDRTCPRCKGLPTHKKSTSPPQAAPVSPPPLPPQPTDTNQLPLSTPHSQPASDIVPMSIPDRRILKGNTKTILSVALAFLLISGVLGNYYWKRTPQYAFLQVQKAISSHDWYSFEQYVDVDECVSSFYDDMSVLVLDDMSRNNNVPTAKQDELFARSLFATMKQTAVANTKTEIRNLIEDENTGTSSQVIGASGFSPRQIKNKIQSEGIQFSKLDYIKRNGDEAFVGLAFDNTKDSRKSFVLELKMTWLNDHWTIRKISNMAELATHFNNISKTP